MRALLDDYVTANRSETLAKLDDFSFLDIIKVDDVDGNTDDDFEVDPDAEQELGGRRGVAETMTSNTRRVINRKRETNPEEYRYFSEKINRLLEEYQQGTIEYKEYLKSIVELCKELKQRNAGDPRIDSELKQSLYDNLGKNVELALSVYKAVVENAKVGFRENKQRKLKVKKAIENVLQNEDPTGELAEKILKIVIANREVQP
jgi:type I restriction enzyme R subunit